MKKLGYVVIGAWLCGACGAVPEGTENEIASTDEAIYGGSVSTLMPEVGSLDANCAATLVAPDIAVTRGICAVGVEYGWFNAKEFRKGTEENNFEHFTIDAAMQHPDRDLGLVHLTSPALDPSLPSTIALGDSAPPRAALCRTYGFAPVEGSSYLQKRSALMTVASVSGSTFVTRKNTGIPTWGDAGAPVISGGLLKGVVSGPKDDIHSLADNVTMDGEWVNSHLSDLRPPTVTNSLYAVSNDLWLWRINDQAGNMDLLSHAYSDTVSMTAIGSRIFRSTRFNLEVSDAETGDVMNSFNGAYAILHNKGNVLYALSGGALYKYTNLDTGARVRIGSSTFPQATSMGSVGGLLYVISNGYLYAVSAINGYSVQLGGYDWYGPTAMATVGTSLYIAQDGHLWTITDRETGAYAPFQMDDWSGPIAMASMNGYLWVVRGGTLYRIDRAGGYTAMTPAKFIGQPFLAAVP